MKTLYTTLIAAGLLLASGCACAATVDFDFGNLAINNERGVEGQTFTSGGISVTVSGNGTNNAYLDHDKNGNAGLGVCKNLKGTQCAVASDDNVQKGESIKLVFDQEVTLDTAGFSDGKHGTDFKYRVYKNKWVYNTHYGIFGLGVDGGKPVTHRLGDPVDLGVTGTTFLFTNPNFKDVKETQFYLNNMTVSAVPIPPAVWLFGAGLLGLIGVARRKSI